MGLALSPVLGEASEALRGLGPRTHGAVGTAWATDEMEPRAGAEGLRRTLQGSGTSQEL